MGSKKELSADICPECGSRQTYYRRKTNDHACKKCPATFIIKSEQNLGGVKNVSSKSAAVR